LKLRLLDGVDLPKLMGSRGLLEQGHGTLATTWLIDASSLEGALQHPRRGDGCYLVMFEQFQANPTSTPPGMSAPELTGEADDGLRIGRG
jgi:hypothetical protein